MNIKLCLHNLLAQAYRLGDVVDLHAGVRFDHFMQVLLYKVLPEFLEVMIDEGVLSYFLLKG